MQNKNLKLKLGLCGLALTSFLALNTHSTVHADTVQNNNANNNAITWDSDSDDSQVVKNEPQQPQASQTVQKQAPVQSNVQVKQTQPVQKKVMVSSVSSAPSSQFVQNRAEKSIVRQSNVQTSTVNRLNVNNRQAISANTKVATVHDTAQSPVQATVVGQWNKGSKIYGITGTTVGISDSQEPDYELIGSENDEPLFKFTNINISPKFPDTKSPYPDVQQHVEIQASEDALNSVLLKTGWSKDVSAVVPTWYNFKVDRKNGYADYWLRIPGFNSLKDSDKVSVTGSKATWIPAKMRDHFFFNAYGYLCYVRESGTTWNSGDTLPATFRCYFGQTINHLSDNTSYLVDTGQTYNGKQVGMLVLPHYTKLESGSYELDKATKYDNGMPSDDKKAVGSFSVSPDNTFGDYVLPKLSTLNHKDGDVQSSIHHDAVTGDDGTQDGWTEYGPDGNYLGTIYGGGGQNGTTYIDTSTGGPATPDTVNVGANGVVAVPHYSGGTAGSDGYSDIYTYDKIVQPQADYNYTVVPVDLKTGDVISGLALQGADTKNGKISTDASLITPQIKQDILNLNKYTPNYVGIKANTGVQLVEALRKIDPKDTRLNKSAERIISVNLPDDPAVKARYKGILDAKNQIVQTISFTRTGTENIATGAVTYGNWQGLSSFPAVTLPDIPGYTMTIN